MNKRKEKLARAQKMYNDLMECGYDPDWIDPTNLEDYDEIEANWYLWKELGKDYAKTGVNLRFGRKIKGT